LTDTNYHITLVTWLRSSLASPPSNGKPRNTHLLRQIHGICASHTTRAAFHNALTIQKPLRSIEVYITIARLSQGFGELMSLLPVTAGKVQAMPRWSRRAVMRPW